MTATGPEGTSHTWMLSDRCPHAIAHIVHAKVGEVVALPYLGTDGKPSREEIALFEVRGSDIRADQFDAIAIQNGQIELRGLAAGDYDLCLKKTRRAQSASASSMGRLSRATFLAQCGIMEVPGLKPVHIQSVTADAEALTIRLRDHVPVRSRACLCHALLSRPSTPSPISARVRDAELGGVLPGHADSVYLTGRNIGDEYRYVLDRRGHRKYPGNLLERPSFLLNPWAIRSTETGEQLAAGGDVFRRGGQFEAPKSIAPATPAEAAPNAPPGSGDFANLDFLADGSAVLLNLTPDKDGVVKLTRKDLGPHAMIHVVAVDPLGTTYRTISLPETAGAIRRSAAPPRSRPDSAFHAAEASFGAGEGAGRSRCPTPRPADSRCMTAWPRSMRLYATLSKDPKLAEFAFILTWPKLKPEEKRALYSKFACHELNFFLLKKDPQFFGEVVSPYLANKKDKTFLDHWLIRDDLRRFKEPWEYGRLNTVERVLLAQRIDGEQDRTARHLSDRLRLLPTNIDRQIFLFDAGLAGRRTESR